jgi:DNA-binding Lrp family transcriptional regulator
MSAVPFTGNRADRERLDHEREPPRDYLRGLREDPERGLTMQAFVLVQTEVGRAMLVAAALSEVDGVESAEAVLGPYDVVVRVNGADRSAIAEIIGRVQKTDSITRTLTCEIAETPAAADR